MRSAWLLVLAGCDTLLHFQHVDPRNDAPPIDVAPIDMRRGDVPVDVANITCPAGYNQDALTHSWYRYVGPGADFVTAADSCAGDEQITPITGHTHLAVISDNQEREILGSYTDAWIGITDLHAIDQWRWVSTEPQPFDPSATDSLLWVSGEPNNSGSEDCGTYEAGQPGLLNNVMCSDIHSYLCECDVYPNDPNAYQ